MKAKNGFWILAIGLVAAVSCKKKEIENPYANQTIPQNENPDLVSIEQSNFAYLHAKIFKPTCANSGCHDGTFEPEFRSIASSYNTMVNHAGISNDFNNSFPVRVVPGSATTSLLYARLTQELPNSSGIMPLVANPGSDWPANATAYIQLIKNWIDTGAKDMFGNAPGDGSADLPPQADGLAVFPPGNTTTPYPREDGIGITPILVPAAQVDVWLRAVDDNTTSASISGQIKFAVSAASLDAAPPLDFVTSGQITALDFSNNSADFRHRATIDLTGLASGTSIYLRVLLDDGVQTQPSAIPNPGSSAVIQAIFILKIQ